MPKRVTMIVPDSQLAQLGPITANATGVQVEDIESERGRDEQSEQPVTFKDVQGLCEAIQNSNLYKKVRAHVGGDIQILLTLDPHEHGGDMKIEMHTGIGMNGRGGALHLERYGSSWEILRKGDDDMDSGEIPLDEDGCPEFTWSRG